MSEQKQLTVAEILAKAQQENPEAGTRRRRRRSLEDGGVSVAELTGSLKKVDAKPVESRHSSVPIDAPEPVKAEPAQAEPKPAEPKAKAATSAGSTRYSAPASKEATATAPKAVETTVSKPKPTPKPVPQAKPQTEDQADSKPGREDETTVIRKVTAQEPKRVETKPAKPAEPAELSEPELEAKEPAPSMAETSPNVAPVVEAKKPAAQQDLAATTEAEADFDEFLEPEAAPAEEIVIEDEGVNPILLVLLVFLGVLVGIAGFLAFQWLWSNTSPILAAVLSIAAVAGAVFGARSVGTGRDWLTTTLAGVAAIVVAFGPALI